MQAPPKPYHILAQQLMALVPAGAGDRPDASGSSWLAIGPRLRRRWTAAVVTTLVDFMIAYRILWSDEGILSFAPEGEAKYGRQNFMDLLSVFTSPPLFQVPGGRKELGSVHESTFFNRDDGPPVLVLAGRCWKTNHLDWRRRIAHVEPTERAGQVPLAGRGAVPELPGLPGDPGDPGGR